MKEVIRQTKKLCYNTQTKNSTNKIKTKWSIIKNNTSKTGTIERISELNLENKNIKDAKEIACALKFFLSVAENLNTDHLQTGKAIKLLKDIYIDNTKKMKIIPVTEAEKIRL